MIFFNNISEMYYDIYNDENRKNKMLKSYYIDKNINDLRFIYIDDPITIFKYNDKFLYYDT